MSELALAPLLVILVASIAVVVYAGTLLARAGDEIAEHTGLGRIFIGALFIAVATSLPELGTNVTAAASNAPDLAISDLFGSSMANMAILAVVDLRYRGRLLPSVELEHTRIAAIAIGMTALAMLGIASPPGVDIGGVGITPIVLGVGYVAALAWFRRVPPIGVASATPTPFREPRRFSERWTGLGPQLGKFAIATVALAMSAPLLALTTEEVAERADLSQGILGVTLLAVTTSLPELVTSLAAVKMGAYDLAVGNLLGSNAANIAMILFVDIAYRPGPVLAAVDEVTLIAATGSILMMALALASIVSGKANRASRLEPDSIMLLIAYVGCVAAVVAAG